MLSSVLSFRHGCVYFRNPTLIFCLEVAALMLFDVLLWVFLPQLLQENVILYCLGSVQLLDIFVNMFFDAAWSPCNGLM